jgi:hypothetical protein
VYVTLNKQKIITKVLRKALKIRSQRIQNVILKGNKKIRLLENEMQ